MKKKIYIAGKVSGTDPEETAAKFAKVQKEIEAQGFEVFNPLEIVGTWDITWEKAMKVCVIHLMLADAAIFLDDFTESRGALIEHRLASEVGIPTLRGTRNLKERLEKQFVRKE